jgi:hypothetical protein
MIIPKGIDRGKGEGETEMNPKLTMTVGDGAGMIQQLMFCLHTYKLVQIDCA